MNKKKSKLKIIDKEYIDNYVNINDKIKINFIYDDEIDMDEILLTGKHLPDDNEITLNSSLGREIYKKEIGSIIEYKVNNNIIKIQIIDIKKIDKI